MSDVRVVILNYNTRELLRACLRSLLADAANQERAIVVVDNASHDGSPAMVRTEFPAVRVIESSCNQGFSAGNNLGAAGASEPYLLFLNADTLVPYGAIGALVGFMERHPECGAVGPRLLNPDGTVQWSPRTFPGPLNTLLEGFGLDRLWPRSRFFGRPKMTYFDHSTSSPVEYLSGAALLVRREAFESVGGWSEDYFFYAEDADLCRALWKAGWQVWFHGAVAITHIGGASARQHGLQTTIEAHRSVFRFALRVGGPRRLLLQRLATCLVNAPRLAVSLAFLPLALIIGGARSTWGMCNNYAHVLHTALTPLRNDPYWGDTSST
ncbi:MAG: glycosyltransferase family 2 protein [Candidatus Zipacnadales bacterium]